MSISGSTGVSADYLVRDTAPDTSTSAFKVSVFRSALTLNLHLD